MITAHATTTATNSRNEKYIAQKLPKLMEDIEQRIVSATNIGKNRTFVECSDDILINEVIFELKKLGYTVKDN